MKTYDTKRIISAALFTVLLFMVQHLSASPNGMISRQISQTVSQEVNKNISDNIVKKTIKPERVVEDKQLYAKALIKKAQKLLKKQGFKPGVADGVMGGNTRRAISAFQKSKGIKVDGRLTEGLLQSLN